MKKIEKILGLPVIDITSGNQIGNVWDIIINGDKGLVDYFIIDDGMMIFGAKVVAASDVQGIGENALTVAKKDVLADIAKVEPAIKLYKKNVRVKGTDVLTQKGRLIGKIGDIFINENNCSISALEFVLFDNSKGVMTIPRDKVITFGEKLIVVVENLEDVLGNTLVTEITYPTDDVNHNEFNTRAARLISDEQKDVLYVDESNQELIDDEPEVLVFGNENNEPKAVVNMHNELELETNKKSLTEVMEEKLSVKGGIKLQDIEEEKIKFPTIDEQFETINQLEEVQGREKGKPEAKEFKSEQVASEVFEEGIAAANYTSKPQNQYKTENKHKSDNRSEEDPKSSNLFEEKQKEFLMGRKVTKTIKDKMGKVILAQGDVVTEEAINIAKESGKLIEIVMNNKP